jgi:hypothetical protein
MDLPEASRKMNVTYRMDEGWPVKLWTPDFRKRLEELDAQNASRQDRHNAIWELPDLEGEYPGELQQVMIMSITGWIVGAVRCENGEYYVDAGHSVFPLYRSSSTGHWVTKAGWNKNCAGIATPKTERAKLEDSLGVPVTENMMIAYVHLNALNDTQRQSLLSVFCVHCGTLQGAHPQHPKHDDGLSGFHGICQCWNDQ